MASQAKGALVPPAVVTVKAPLPEMGGERLTRAFVMFEPLA